LLKGFKDDALFLLRDADSSIAYGEGHHALDAAEHRVSAAPPGGRAGDLQFYRAVLGKLQGVRQQILQHLLKTLGIGVNRLAQSGVEFDREVEAFALGHVTERARAVVLKLHQLHRAEFDVHLARLDLGKVENVVDERQQVGRLWQPAPPPEE